MPAPTVNGTAHVNGVNGVNGVKGNSITAPEPVSPEAFEELFKAIQVLSKDSVVQKLSTMATDYKELKVANSRNFKSIAEAQVRNDELEEKYRQKDEELEEARKTIEKLQEDLAKQKEIVAEKDERMANSANVMSQVQANFNLVTADLNAAREGMANHVTERQKLEKDLEDKKAENEKIETRSKAHAEKLKTVAAFLLKPKSITDEEITKHLDDIFTSAYTFVEACFGEDLEEEALANGNWKKFRDKFPDFPLPPSNSPDAKRMRIAAVLRYLAQASTVELFQPVYLTQQGDEVSELLDDMEDRMKADWLRRSLLNTDPERQKANASLRAQAVKKDVSDLVAGILTHDRHSRFTADLGRWCEATAAVWRTELQPLKHKIDPLVDLDDEETEVDEWAPLAPTDAWSPGAEAEEGGQPPPALKSMADVAARVWPVFTALHLPVAKKGLAITAAQAAKSKEEETKAIISPPGSRRANRGRQRSMTAGTGGLAPDQSLHFLGQVSPAVSVNGG